MILPVGIALGSNVGDRVAELNAATAFLRTLSRAGEIAESLRIETTPVDCPPESGVFLNSVVEIQIDFEKYPPRVLLGFLQDFEISRGRLREREINAPRPLDLDILYYGELVLNEPDLVIPHPRSTQRRFVLEPLAHLRPDLILPGQAKTVRQLLESLPLG